MLLLAESGATRSHWVLADHNWKSEIVTLGGFNPNYHQPKVLAGQLEEIMALLVGSAPVNRIIYYGSGCAAKHRSDEVRQLISKHFPVAGIQVHGDLLAAARGLFGNEPGLAAILGTGSNAGLYDGSFIVRTMPSLGYIMGDEGSGTHLGKLLVKAYVTHQMPDALAAEFESFTGHSTESIVGAVYTHPQPGNYLASLAPFLSVHPADQFCQLIVGEAFAGFFNALRPLVNPANAPQIAATGSVAAHFAGQFVTAAERGGFTVCRVVGSPFAGLINYHQQRLSE